jgi:hypothetical protein
MIFDNKFWSYNGRCVDMSNNYSIMTKLVYLMTGYQIDFDSYDTDFEDELVRRASYDPVCVMMLSGNRHIMSLTSIIRNGREHLHRACAVTIHGARGMMVVVRRFPCDYSDKYVICEVGCVTYNMNEYIGPYLYRRVRERMSIAVGHSDPELDYNTRIVRRALRDNRFMVARVRKQLIPALQSIGDLGSGEDWLHLKQIVLEFSSPTAVYDNAVRRLIESRNHLFTMAIAMFRHIFVGYAHLHC